MSGVRITAPESQGNRIKVIFYPVHFDPVKSVEQGSCVACPERCLMEVGVKKADVPPEFCPKGK